MANLNEKSTHIYKTANERPIHLDVHIPERRIKGNPAIVWIHGGALINGDRDGRPERFQKYLDFGYTVFTIDYRLAPETKLPEIISDVQDALTWVRENGPEIALIDPNRIAVAGNSAGGYLALMTGTFATPPKAVIAFYGYGDIVGTWYSEPDPYYCTENPLVSEADAREHFGGPPITRPDQRPGNGEFYLYCRQQGIWPNEVGGRDIKEDPAFFIPYCPEQNVRKTYPPTLLLHGNTDTDVPHDQSVNMARALKADGIEHGFITIEGRGHGFDAWKDDPQVIAAWDAVRDFLAQNV